MSRICLILILALMACGRADDKDSSPPLPGSSFVEETQLPASDTSRFTLGCKTPGQLYGPTIFKLDPRLKQGMSANLSMTSIDRDGKAKQVIYRTNITAISPRKMVTENKVISTLGLTSQIAMSATIDCTESDASISCFNWAFRNVIDKELTSTFTCDVTDLVRETVLTKGRFTLNSQSLTVPAYRERNRWRGTIRCDGGAVEAGERVEEIFYSNEIPGIQFGFANCGGEKVFEKVILRNTAGRIYWTKYRELLSLD